MYGGPRPVAVEQHRHFGEKGHGGARLRRGAQCAIDDRQVGVGVDAARHLDEGDQRGRGIGGHAAWLGRCDEARKHRDSSVASKVRTR